MGRKLNGGDLDTVEDLGAALARMSEDEVVGLRADYVPRIGVWATGAQEIGIYAALENSNAGPSRRLVDSQAGSLLFNTKAAPIYASKILSFA